MRHFAGAQWVGVLRFLAGDRPIVVPDVVERELRDAVGDVPELGPLLDADWLTVHCTADLAFQQVFAGYEKRLAVGRRNLGECGVLAMGRFYGCEIVIDDAEARGIADAEGLVVVGTVQLLCDAVRAKKLTLAMVEDLADHLLETHYHLPFGKGGFRRHVLENGLLDYDEV